MVPNAITIQCTNASGIKISGNNAVRVFEISPDTDTMAHGDAAKVVKSFMPYSRASKTTTKKKAEASAAKGAK